MRQWAAILALVALGAAAAAGGWQLVGPPTPGPVRIGAVFPLTGNAAGLADQERQGVQIAVDLVNADGGVGGRRVLLEVRDLETAQDAPAIMANFKADGVQVVIGAYSSGLSIAASSAASAAGLVYWEAGAVADQLTGRGLALVFRVGASGTNLGSNSAAFTAEALAPRLDKAPSAMRLAIVNADDAYASSVADAAAASALRAGMPIVARATYSLTLPQWPTIMSRLAAARPDVIILASHIPDGVAFRQAMLAAGLHVSALIGSTMAECSPDFAGELGADAIGVFASDRPTGGFQPSALSEQARTVYRRLAFAWASRMPTHGAIQGYWGTASTADPSVGAVASPSVPAASAYTIAGPIEEGSAASGPTEEGISGFTAAWALLHDVLPVAARTGDLTAQGIALAARNVDLPMGSLPNGAGLRFSSDPDTLGQNTRAAAVIWQWQAVRSYAFVWPSTYATGAISSVPLTR